MSLVREVEEATAHLKSRVALPPKYGVIFGSGLSVDRGIDARVEIPYGDVPHFPKPNVAGHAGKIVSGTVAGKNLLIFAGRSHYYEGYPLWRISLPIRVARMLGVSVLIVTNAAGGINPKLKPGDLMILRDHINLMGDNPLRGENVAEFGPRFIDMTSAYDPELAKRAISSARKLKIRAAAGVYAAMPGPAYETPAEVRMLRRLGADAVGMSTVPEVIVAVHCGLRVLGISCIANQAAGMAKRKLSHDEVVDMGASVKERLWNLIVEVLRGI